MKTTPAILLISIVCTFSCRKEQSSEPAGMSHYERWKSFDLQDYTINQIRSCFCPYGGELFRITVRRDTIAQILRLFDTTLVTYPHFRTVDSLFAIVLNPGTDSLVVRYNDQYGYPEYLDVNPQLHPVDGGFLYETSNLQVQ